MRAGILQEAQALQQLEAAQPEQGQEAIGQKAVIFVSIIKGFIQPYLHHNLHFYLPASRKIDLCTEAVPGHSKRPLSEGLTQPYGVYVRLIFYNNFEGNY